MLVGFDQDGVLSGWDEYLSEQADLHPELDDFPRQPERGWIDYNTARPDHKKIVMKILHHPDFYESLPPIPGALAVIRKVVDDGHDVSIVTTPWDQNPRGHQGKVRWVQKHLGWDYVKRLVITRDKTRWVGDVLIDDKPLVNGLIVPFWKHIYFTQPYNEGLPGPRIQNWTDGTWESVLYGYLEEVQGVRQFDLTP